MEFNEKRVLVTGAGSGIGKGIALRLAQLGSQIIALDISKIALDKLKREIPNLIAVEVDLRNWNKSNEAVRSVLPVDFLVNNAGISSVESITSVTEDMFNSAFKTNVMPLFSVSQAVVEDLLRRDAPGAIVNLSSQLSKVGMPNRTIYSSTKGAVDSFTRTLATELGPRNIRVNAVNPTVVMTDMGKKIWSDPKRQLDLLSQIPLNRLGEVNDVVDGVTFLLSDKASMITGTCLSIDGGYVIQ